MGRSLIGKFAIACLAVVLLAALSLPLGVYWFGLSNISGRPERLARTANIAADTALLQQEFGSAAPVAVHAQDPWSFTASLAMDVLLDKSAKDLHLDNGSRAIWLVASDYNIRHLKSRRGLRWHISGVALSIWLSRNWTTEEVIAASAAIVRNYRPSFDPSLMNEVLRIDDFPKNLKTVLQSSFGRPGEGPGGRCCVFLVGGLSETSALAAYENYGYVPTFQAHAYVLTKSKQWVYAGGWTISAVSKLDDLKALTSRPPDSLVF
jgi:hypothetical protein